MPADPVVSPADTPRCVPLCGMEQAYGERAASDPMNWWKHEALCPMREHLRHADREKVAAYHGRTAGGMEW